MTHPHHYPHLYRRQRGALLIVVLFVLTVLSLIALSLTYRTGLETRSAHRRVIQIRLRALSRSAVAVALNALSQNTNDFDHLAESWHTHPHLADLGWFPLLSAPAHALDTQPAYKTTYQVMDEGGKLNILYASSDMLTKLGLTKPQIDGIFDWGDPGKVARAEGAESDLYQQLPSPYYAKNAPMQMLDELLLVHGVTPAAYYGDHLDNQEESSSDSSVESPDAVDPLGLVDLLRCVGDDRINLNTAPEAVLRTLPISSQAVDQILGYRHFDTHSAGALTDHVFRSVKDIDALQGLTDADRAVLEKMGKFTSQYYRIFVNSYYVPSGQRVHLEILVRADHQAPQVIQWQ